MENIDATRDWKAGQKLLFRFFACYFALYMIPSFVIGPTIDPLAKWTGRHILHLEIINGSAGTGSGDTALAYAQLFLIFVLSSLSCVIWTIADRKRSNYDWLLYRLKVAIRCYLGFFLLVYGYAKFSHGQFSSPSLYRLSQPYGDSSPMGLAWTFFGYSTGYRYFMGFSECIGGVLLLFRRTALLGACISAAVMLNVVMVNLCFDVPVKLFSSHLFLMSLFIVVTSGKRLIDFFIFNKATAPENTNIGFEQKGWRIAGSTVKATYLIVFVVALLPGSNYKAEAEKVKNTPLYGLYVAQPGSFFENPAGGNSDFSLQWSKLVIQNGPTLLQMQDQQLYYPSFELDTFQKQLKMVLHNKAYNLHYWMAKDSSILFWGRYGADSVCIKMRRYTESKYLLTNRGFHWINEYPFNR